MVSRRPGENDTPPTREKLIFRPMIEIDAKTSKAQVNFITGWNEMRNRLLELGEMEEK